MTIGNARFSIEEAWKSLLELIYKLGEDVEKDDAPIRERMGIHLRIENPTKNMLGHTWPSDFIKWIRKGVYDIDDYPLKGDALADYVDSISDLEKINAQGFVYTYPERIRMMPTVSEDEHPFPMDQMNNIIRRLESNLGSNRAIAVLYQAGIDAHRTDIPCLQLIQAFVRNDKLILSVYFRSNDIYGAFPSNMLFISHIGLMIAVELNKRIGYRKIEFDCIDYHASSAHYYKTDENAVKRILEG